MNDHYSRGRRRTWRWCAPSLAAASEVLHYPRRTTSRANREPRACPQSHDAHVGRHVPLVNVLSPTAVHTARSHGLHMATRNHRKIRMVRRQLHREPRAWPQSHDAGQARAARQPRHHVLALDSDKRLCYQGGPNARRHCMSTARVSAIPTPRSATCRGRCRGRCRAARRTGTIGLIKPRAW